MRNKEYWESEILKDQEEFMDVKARLMKATDPKEIKECRMIMDLLLSHIKSCERQINGY